MLPYSSSADDALFSLLKDDDQSAFAELYDRYHKRVYGYFFTLIKVPYLCEDLVHEAFLKIWSIRSSAQLHTSFPAYLFRLCHNMAVDMTRKIARDRQMFTELNDEYAIAGALKDKSETELKRLDGIVEEALASLTPQRRLVYELCRFQGKTYQQVAEELNISVHTVKEHMSKALMNLRKFLEQKGELIIIFTFLENFIKK